MRNWDLNSGTAKLELAMQSLQIAGAEVQEYWTDETYRKFQETYITPLEPKVRDFLDSIRRLAEVLASADRQCGMDRHDGII